MSTAFSMMDSPVGLLTLVLQDQALTAIRFQDDGQIEPEARRDDAALAPAIDQLAQYFAGRRQSFDLPLAPSGTPFQLRVWTALSTIPYGTTLSYADLAVRIGKPSAVRAVGSANGRNPLPIVIPCHRVIGRDGRLAGYGGGLGRKQRLLELEGLSI